MKEKLCSALRKLYGTIMAAAFWGGLAPLPFFIAAMFLGGEGGEKLSVFLYKKYYPVIIAAASIAVVLGLVSMYLGGKEGMSAGSVGGEKK